MHSKHIQYWKDHLRAVINKVAGPKFTKLDEVFCAVSAHGYSFDNVDALEVFGMHGLWVTAAYLPRCNSVDLWEIEPTYAGYARKLGPKVSVFCDDSIRAVRTNDGRLRKYDFIVLDNSSRIIYGNNYCEHFDLFPYIFRYFKPNKPGLLLLNFLPSIEFDAANRFYAERLNRRMAFYETQQRIVNLSHAISIYNRYAKAEGFEIRNYVLIPRTAVIHFLALIIEPL